MNKYWDKIKSKKGSTTLVEILIVTPIIVIIMFYSIGAYQMMMQQSYVEDVKYRMTQKMSRDGQLATTDINHWKTEMENMRGVTVKGITPVGVTSIGTIMESTVTVELETAVFSSMLGGEYKTKAVIYSERR